jgi:site-specific recombinase XerD
VSTLTDVTGLRYLRSRSLERSDLAPHHQRYATLRDEFVIGFRYQTARAYAADLDHLFTWTLALGLDVMDLTDRDIERYVAKLKVENFSPNTMIRKRTALRGFYSLATATQARTNSPMTGWPWRRRSETLGLQPT